jgi:iron complex transport system substrate-binding protein
MTRRLASLGLAACIAALACAAQARPPQRAAATPAAPAAAAVQRIVSLAPHLTELVFAAGGGERVVGVTRYSDFPPAAQLVPVIGDAFTLDYEALLQLKPDLILAWSGGTPRRQLDKLRSLQLPVREIQVTRIDDVPAVLRQLGQWIGTQATAEAAAAAYESQVAALRARYAGRAIVPVFYEIWDAPLMTVGRRHVIDEAITLCGGRNVFGDIDALTATVSREAVVKRRPLLIVAGDSLNESAARMRRGWQRLEEIPAVAQNHIATVDGDLLNRMGPRLVRGIAALCSAIDAAR